VPLAPAHRSVLLSPTSRRATAAATPPTGLIVAALALATLVAALLRLPFLARGSFWFDETYTVGVVSAPTV
jgi:hypothetical protein